MTQPLDDLLQLARDYQMSPSESLQQLRSWVFGNVHLENPEVTREEVNRVVDRMFMKSSENEPNA